MLGIVSHPDCLAHEIGPWHPDTAERLGAIQNQLLMSGLDFVVRHYDAPLAEREQLLAAHASDLVDMILALKDTAEITRLDDDTVIGPHSVNAALRAAGAGILAVDLVMRDEAAPVFCAIRPPGHHATRHSAMGFCLFNNVAVAACHALGAHGLERVAIVDFDAHHGNGTEDIIRDERRVLFCSSFQHPFYPFTGAEKETANLVDTPLPAGAGSVEFRAAVRDHWLPALERFRPQLVLVSAGFDGHVLDDMSGLNLTEADYDWITRELVALARRHAGGRLISILEGGYEPGALARSVIAHLKAMLEM